MHIQVIYAHTWTVGVILKADKSNPFLCDMPGQVWNVFAGTLRHISLALDGPRVLPANRNHQLDGKIWQLSASHPYRAPYFFQPGNRLIVTHIFAKHGGKRQNTPKAEIEKAQDLLGKYKQASQLNELEFIFPGA